LQPKPISITGIILAGGRSRRMDGNDKGLLPLNNRAMIEYVIETLSPQVDEVLISANRNQEDYSRFGYTVITDQIEGYVGPLAGMASAIQACNSEFILTAPCDGPWVPADLAERLLSQLKKEGSSVSSAHDGERLQPVFTLIHRRLLPSILSYLESGERRLGYWVKQQKPALTDFSDQPEAFFNVNSPAELKVAETHLHNPSHPASKSLFMQNRKK